MRQFEYTRVLPTLRTKQLLLLSSKVASAFFQDLQGVLMGLLLIAAEIAEKMSFSPSSSTTFLQAWEHVLSKGTGHLILQVHIFMLLFSNLDVRTFQKDRHLYHVPVEIVRGHLALAWCQDGGSPGPAGSHHWGWNSSNESHFHRFP